MYNPEYASPRTNMAEHSLAHVAIASPELLQRISECPRGTPLTFGATPLDYLQTLEQQASVRTSLMKMTYSCPGEIPMQIASHVHTAFGRRITGREQANNDNYVTSLMYERQHEIDPIVLDMVHKAELGQASPAELILVRDVMGIRSVELACLTHPYGGERLELLLEPMRDAVKYAVLTYEGDMVAEPESIYAVKEAVKEFDEDADDLEAGVVMTRKRVLGHLPDGTIVKERSSFVLRTDADAALPIDIRLALQELDVNDPDWKQQMLEIEGMQEYIARLLADDEYTQAIPLSTTIYAYNKETAELVAQHKAKVDAAREAEYQQQKERINALIAESKADEERRRHVTEEISKIIKEDFPYFNSGKQPSPFEDDSTL